MNWWPHYDVTIQVTRHGRPVRKTVRIAAPNRIKAENQVMAAEKNAKLLSSTLALWTFSRKQTRSCIE